jgi:hypothetical protein
MTHEAGSLPELVQNLVKNWEVEASFKPVLSDWRTIDHDAYSFAINSSAPEGAEAMLKVGTYNAIIAPNEFYSPEYSDFASSHKTFKRMMPTFAWEVLEVYSGPPTVAFRWRHWGVMKNDYVGLNNRGERVTVRAHGGDIDVEGVTVATVNDKVQLQAVRTWFDPMDMFRQIARDGPVDRVEVDKSLDPADALNAPNAGIGKDKDATTATATLDASFLGAVAAAGCPFTAIRADGAGNVVLPADYPPVAAPEKDVVEEAWAEDGTVRSEVDPEQHGKFDEGVEKAGYMPGGFR